MLSQSSYHFLLFIYNLLHLFPFFFFQAEDGIRDGHVTGVQTCALPISPSQAAGFPQPRHAPASRGACRGWPCLAVRILLRSEERRVGKECGSLWECEKER